MKFCPECGRKRENDDECFCGYNYLTGIREEKPDDNFKGIQMMNEISNIEPNQGIIPLKELKKRKLDIGDLLSVTFTTSGGMMGSYHQDEISFETNELTIINQEWHHGERKETKYKTDAKKVQEMKKLLLDNNFRAWSEVPINRSMIAFDAPTSSISLRFKEKTVSFSTQIYMDKEENNIFLQFVEMINSLIIKENIISEKILTSGQQLNFMSNVNVSFCPECARPLINDKCECGYEKKH